MDGRRRFLLVRHGQTTYNAARRLNGDPAIPVHLDAEGRAQARALRPRLAREPIDLAAHTRHVRTLETLELALDGREVPRVRVGELDDIRLGVMEGRPVLDYRSWRRAHGDAVPLPGGGESRLDAIERYADGYERLLATSARCLLAVLHDVPIRAIVNAARGEHPIHGGLRHVPNASPFELGEDSVRRGVAGLRRAVAAGRSRVARA